MENYKIPFIVKILDKLLPPFMGKNVDYQTVRKILILKLTLDGRRTSAVNKAQSSGKSNPKNTMLLNYIMFGVMGVMTSFLQLSRNAFAVNTISYGVLIFLLLSVYISEYSEVLLDTREKPFFRVLPIREKELTIAKNIHISIYIGGIAGVTILPSLLMAFIFQGFLYGVLYLAMAVLVVLFCLWFAGAMYYFLLRIFSGEKLKDVLNYFQVFVTIAIILGYQIIPRIINLDGLDNLKAGVSPLLLLVPPAWYAAIFGIVFQGQTTWFFGILSAIGLLAVVLLWFASNFYIMPQFEKQLNKLDDVSKENKSLSKYKRMLCKLFSKNEQERAFMELVLIHVSRDRGLKLKLYPQLANAFILPIIIIFPFVFSGSRDGMDFAKMIGQIQASPFYFGLYMIALIAPSVYYIICQTDTPSTTWIYQTLPWRSKNELIKAGIKVVLLHYLNPIFLFMAILLFVVYRANIGLDIVLMFLVYILYSNGMVRLSAWHLPFSISGQIKNPGRQFFYFFVGLFCIAGIGLVHFFLLKTAGLKVIGILILTALNIFWWKYGMSTRTTKK